MPHPQPKNSNALFPKSTISMATASSLPFKFTSPTAVATKTSLQTAPTLSSTGDRFAFSTPKVVESSNTGEKDVPKTDGKSLIEGERWGGGADELFCNCFLV